MAILIQKDGITMYQDLMNVASVARQLAVSRKRVYQLISDGQLDSLRISQRTIRITRQSVHRFIHDRLKEEYCNLGLDVKPAGRRKRIQGL